MKKKVSLAKRLKLAEARADDAQRQFNEAERRRRELQIEANLWHGKFKDAQMHAKVEHDLLTEAREEIASITEENTRIVSEAKETYDWNSKLVTEHYKLGYEIDRLRKDLEYCDSQRRLLERDMLAQCAELAKLQPFNRILGAFPARGPIA